MSSTSSKENTHGLEGGFEEDNVENNSGHVSHQKG